MDCTQMRRFALGGGSLASPEAQKHLEDCAPCRALFAAGPELAELFAASVEPGPAEDVPSFAALESEIARRRGWHERLAELPTRTRWALAAATLAFPAGVGIVRHRHNLAEYPRARFAAELAGLIAVAIACCWLWIRPLFKRQPSAMTAWLLSALALALPLGLASLPAALPASPGSGVVDVLHRALGCFLFGSMLALPALLLLVGVGRRQTGPGAFGVVPAAAAALAGLYGLELHCPNASPIHLLLGHAPIAWVLPLLLAGARQWWKRRASA